MSDLLFVYGALRKGGSNDWRMKDARWLSPAKVSGTLVKIDWYPGLVLGEGSTVQGEVYEVSSSLLKELDEFEGIREEIGSNGEYHRVPIDVVLNGKTQQVWIYEWLKGLTGYQIVESGDWLAPNKL